MRKTIEAVKCGTGWRVEYGGTLLVQKRREDWMKEWQRGAGWPSEAREGERPQRPK